MGQWRKLITGLTLVKGQAFSSPGMVLKNWTCRNPLTGNPMKGMAMQIKITMQKRQEGMRVADGVAAAG